MIRTAIILCLLISQTIFSFHHQSTLKLSGTIFQYGNKHGNSNVFTSLTSTQLHASSSGQSSVWDVICNPVTSYSFGGIGLLITLVNRLGSIDMLVSDVQSRADLISVISCSALLLNALTVEEISARERDSVSLVGFALREPIIKINASPGIEMDKESKYSQVRSWLCGSLFSAAPTVTSIHYYSNGATTIRAGVIGSEDDTRRDIVLGKIARKALEDQVEVYLPDIQILPGKIEFSFLPINIQSVLMLPISPNDLIILGTNKAKSLRVRELERIRAVVDIFRSTEQS